MDELRVTIVLGTRPQIIKSAPVYDALAESGIECDIINTGQHYDYEMNRQFFSELKLPDPSDDLDVGQGTPNEQVSAIIRRLGEVFEKKRPDLVVVPGDTNSALGAGIACSKSGVAAAHLEAGCRSDDFRMAEEVNRRLLDHMSQVLLCPTAGCAKNALGEHVLASVVRNVGDTMYDSVLRYRRLIDGSAGEKLGTKRGGYAFMTLHRAETVDDQRSLESVLRAAGTLGIPVVFGVHPRTRARIKEFGIKPPSGITLVEPLPYLETLALVEGSKLVITDSGGLQKEAYWLGKPTLVTRGTTEWVEIVRAGAAFLVGTSEKKILRGYAMAASVPRRAFAKSRRIFGDGHAASEVAKVVSLFLRRDGKRGS